MTSAPAALQSVWLLAGSAGAISAVQAFFNALPAGLPVAFLYAQHYDPRRSEHLHGLSLQNPAYRLAMATDQHDLLAGDVWLIPPQTRVGLGPGQRIYSKQVPWPGPHTPDVTALMADFAAARLPQPGVVVFSGMGNDGAAGLATIAATGGRIWAQDPADAICAGMPRAAIATGLAQRHGTPAELARALLSLHPPGPLRELAREPAGARKP